MEKQNTIQPRPKPARSRRKFAYASLVSGALLFAFSNSVSHFVTGITQPGGIYIPASQHAFAQAERKGGSLSHTFRIYNFRPTSLSLTAEPDCGCTHVSWKTINVRPFGWTDLTAEMDADET